MVPQFLDPLRSLINELGQEGGQISPSVYDTAQGLRYSPPREGAEAVVEWLLRQQQGDGGWGTIKTVPQTRDMPTLAALLALHPYQQKRPEIGKAIAAGLAFLQNQAQYWQGKIPESFSSGMELIFPSLLDDAKKLGLAVAVAPYRLLYLLKAHRLRQVFDAERNPVAPHLFYTFEGWGQTATAVMIDGAGGIGHSPAATAYWLALAPDTPAFANARAQAKDYLRRASQATQSNIPGLLPTVWPIGRFEQLFSLYTLLQANLLHHPALSGVVAPQLAELASALRPGGYGFSDAFAIELDNTAAAFAVLKSGGYDDVAQEAILQRFHQDGLFVTYQDDPLAEISPMARTAHALSYYGRRAPKIEAELAEAQQLDGLWLGDNWNVSPYYNTFLASFVLAQADGHEASLFAKTATTLQAQQFADGGWGIFGESAAPDSAYALLGLGALRSRADVAEGALENGRFWLANQFDLNQLTADYRWLGKDEYAPYRIDKAFELSAILMGAARSA